MKIRVHSATYADWCDGASSRPALKLKANGSDKTPKTPLAVGWMVPNKGDDGSNVAQFPAHDGDLSAGSASRAPHRGEAAEGWACGPTLTEDSGEN